MLQTVQFVLLFFFVLILISCQKTSPTQSNFKTEGGESADFCENIGVLSTEEGPMNQGDSSVSQEPSDSTESLDLLGDRIAISNAIMVGLDFADASHVGPGGIAKPHVLVESGGDALLKVGVDGRVWGGKIENVSKSVWKSIFSDRKFLSQFEKFIGKCVRSGISPAGIVNVLRPIMSQLKHIPPSFAANLGKVAGVAGRVAASATVGAALEVLFCPSPAHASEMRYCEDVRNTAAQRMYQVAYAKFAYKLLTCEMYAHVNDPARKEYVESLREGRSKLNVSYYAGFYSDFEREHRSCIREAGEDDKKSYADALEYLKTIEAGIEQIPLSLMDDELSTLCDPKTGEYLGE